MTNLSNSSEENNFYHISHTQSAILIGSDILPDFEIDLGNFEHYLLAIDRIGSHYYPEFGEGITITMKDFWQGEACDIDQFLTEYIKAEYICGEPNQEEIPLPSSDPYELVQGHQRPVYFEERYLKHIM